MTITSEGGGHVATCSCKWLRWDASETALATHVREHLKKCKTEGEK